MIPPTFEIVNTSKNQGAEDTVRWDTRSTSRSGARDDNSVVVYEVIKLAILSKQLRYSYPRTVASYQQDRGSQQLHPEGMLAIRESLDDEERLVVNVGTPVRRVSNSSPNFVTVDRVSGICTGGEVESGLDNVYSDIAGFN
jgi:hypothetical protein